MAFRHHCPNAGASGSLRCPLDGKGKGPARCPGCGGRIYARAGRYGVFAYDPANGYGQAGGPRADWYEIEAAARRLADRLSDSPYAPTGGYVVRFITTRGA